MTGRRWTALAALLALAALAGAALLLAGPWRRSGDGRPVIYDQSDVPAAVLERVARDHLGDPAIAASPDEAARHRPWDKLGRYQGASQPFGAAPPAPIKALPGASDASRRVEELMRSGDLDGAEAAARGGLTRAPDDLPLRFLLARIHQVRGDLEASLAGLRRATAAAPGFSGAWLQLAIVLNDLQRGAEEITPARKAGLVGEALAALDRAEALRGPGDHMVHLQRGIVLCFAERFEEAEWDLWKAVEAAPRDGNAYWDIAWVEAQRKDGAAAARVMRFAARDPRLFAMRTCQDEVLSDPYFQPVARDPAFLAWARRLPLKCAVKEGFRGEEEDSAEEGDDDEEEEGEDGD